MVDMFLLTNHQNMPPKKCESLLEQREMSGDWVNMRGVAEYMVLMLLGAQNPTDVEEGIRLLEVFIECGGVWVDAFWSILGKLSERALGGRLFDMLRSALEAVKSPETVAESLTVMSRFSSVGASKLASAVLWSGLLPNVLRWSDLERLTRMLPADLEELMGHLTEALRFGRRHDHLKSMNYAKLLGLVIPYLEDGPRKELESELKLRGRPKKEELLRTMHIIGGVFPEHQGYLLNGLFHTGIEVAGHCAAKIKFVKLGQPAFVELCKSLAKVEMREEVRGELVNSARWIEHDVNRYAQD